MKLELRKPITVNEKKVAEITLDLASLTAKDFFKIDNELKAEGHSDGFNSALDPKVTLKLASKASGIHEDDLETLRIDDFTQLSFHISNFLMGLWDPTDSKKLDESSSDSPQSPTQESITGKDKQLLN